MADTPRRVPLPSRDNSRARRGLVGEMSRDLDVHIRASAKRDPYT